MRSLLLSIVAGTISLVLMSHAAAQVTHVTYFTQAVPVTSFYVPTMTSVPVTTFFAPTVTSAMPVTTFFTPATTVAYRPVAVATTRFRPILGGTVTRFRTAYSPVVVNPLPVFYAY